MGAGVRTRFLMGVESNTATVEAAQACWSCGDMCAAHFCTSCGKVQPPTPVDYFTFFGLPRKLNLDTAALEREFYVLSRKLHPDVYAGRDSQEQEWSLEQSSRLNDAYRTLKDPIRRTEYLLHLEGVELEGQSKAATEEARKTGEKKQIVPPDLLEDKFSALFEELKGYWNEWDAIADSGSTEKRLKVRDKMVDLLNRRSYIR